MSSTFATFLTESIEKLGVHSVWIKPLCVFAITVISFIILTTIYLILRRLVEPRLKSYASNTDTRIDDILFEKKVPKWVWLLVVCLIAYYLLPYMYGDYKSIALFARNTLRLALIITIAKLIANIVATIFCFLAFVKRDEEYDPKRIGNHSLKGLQQMCVIIVYGVAAVLIISVLVNKDPIILVSGLGAMAAILMLVFQDSILGVVAGIQLTANNMMKVKDWVIVPKYGANGIVEEITLAAVKIRNWDNSVSSIQPYKLLTEGFQNWESMKEKNGRRIARSINIDMNTIRFGSAEEVASWRAAEWGSRLPAEGDVVNLTAFREYLHHYVQSVPTFVPYPLFMIRELQPDAYGLPLEIYFFVTSVEWKEYEQIQSDTFDFIIARLSEFGLRVHQVPTGHDMRSLRAEA